MPAADRWHLVDVYFWERLPSALGRISWSIGLILADGQYLRRNSKVGAALPLTVAILGFLAGALHSELFGFPPEGASNGEALAKSFSSSPGVVILSAALGAVSPALALLFITAYAVTDLLIFQPLVVVPAAEEIRRQMTLLQSLGFNVGLIASYLIWAQLAVLTPFMARYAALALFGNRLITMGQKAAAFIEGTICAIVQGALVVAWIAAFPFLIRTVHVLNAPWGSEKVWGKFDPRVVYETFRHFMPYDGISVYRDFRDYSWHLVGVCVAAILARFLLETFFAINPRDRLISSIPALRTQRDWRFDVAAKTGITILFISGVLTYWSFAFLAFVVFAAAYSLTDTRSPFSAWYLPLVNRVPLALRLLIGLPTMYFLLKAYWLDNLFKALNFKHDDTLNPFALSAIFAIVAMILLFPPRSSAAASIAA